MTLTFSSLPAMVMTRKQKFKVNGLKIEWKQRHGQTDGGDCITSHSRSLTRMCSRYSSITPAVCASATAAAGLSMNRVARAAAWHASSSSTDILRTVWSVQVYTMTGRLRTLQSASKLSNGRDAMATHCTGNEVSEIT